MKKILFSLMALCLSISGFSNEGMWLPFLIQKNIDSIQAMGGRLSAEDIYSINQVSLKDAVVIFGGGCTGEMISEKGLLITNHHCGYGSIAALSSVTDNYLEDGFWSKSLKAELPAPGLSVKFLVRMEDVTDELEKAANKRNYVKAQKKLGKLIEAIETKASEGGKYLAQVYSFAAGNQYILMVYQVFEDVRLVATPPNSLGKFGGNTDNWMWPRHTCDFSVFRVYADSLNQPAKYSEKNVPYRPKKFLKISLKEREDQDFSLIMGFPGRTSRYLTSYGVDLAINETNPAIVKIRDLRLAIMREAMRKDEAVNLKLATEYAQVSNYWKYFIGQTEQLKRLKVVKSKQKEEQAFVKWAKDQGRSADAQLMNEFAKSYAGYRPVAKHSIYYREAFGASKLVRIGAMTNALRKALEAKKQDPKEIEKAVAVLKSSRSQFLKDYVETVDRKIFSRMAELYYLDIPKAQLPSIYQELILRQFAADSLRKTFDDFTDYTYSHTFLIDDQAFAAFCSNPTLEALDKDPATRFTHSFIANYYDHYQPKVQTFQEESQQLEKRYLAGIQSMHPDRLFYPDANSTMRVTYGTIGGYSPQDGVEYKYYTTIDGLMAKYVEGDPEFDLPVKFRSLVEKGDFGPYANKEGNLTTCFISNNDITGGNSGSPIMDKDGHLIGLAFDGNWEAMSGDIAFDKKYKRTISVDIRFVLWVIDYYGGAKNIVSEMTFVH